MFGTVFYNNLLPQALVVPCGDGHFRVCLVVSLIAAMAYFFSLERKETKVQERGNASTRRPAPSFGMSFARISTASKMNCIIARYEAIFMLYRVNLHD